MAVTFGTPTSETDDTGAGLGVTITKPAGLVDGCHLVMLVTTRSSTSGRITSWTVPSGFTQVGSNDTGTSSVHQSLFIKPITTASSEPASYTVSFTWNAAYSGDVVGILIPVFDSDGTGTVATNTGSVTNAITFDTLTPVSAGSIYLAWGVQHRTNTYTWGTGLTELEVISSTNATAGNRVTGFLAYKAVEPPSATGILTATSSDSRAFNASGTLLAPFTPSPPNAAAGADQTVDAGTYVTLDGTASTGTGSVTYAWTQTAGTPTAILADATTSTAHFFAPVGATALTFRLTVTDANGSDTDDTIVTCNALPTGGVAPTYGVPILVRDTGAWL